MPERNASRSSKMIRCAAKVLEMRWPRKLKVIRLTEYDGLVKERASGWAAKLNERDEHIRLLTENAVASEAKLNERDEHIRLLTENAVASEAKLNERDEHIRLLT